MATVEHLLVTTDFSEAATVGVRTARDLALQLESRLSLLHVAEEILPPLIFTTEAQRSELHRQALEAAREALAECYKEHLQDVPCEVLLREGTAHMKIVECAREIGADLIVMASQGRGSVEQLIYGSTTQRVIQTASCPVVAVPPGLHEGG